MLKVRVTGDLGLNSSPFKYREKHLPKVVSRADTVSANPVVSLKVLFLYSMEMSNSDSVKVREFHHDLCSEAEMLAEMRK